jgi:hypothetical protein
VKKLAVLRFEPEYAKKLEDALVAFMKGAQAKVDKTYKDSPASPRLTLEPGRKYMRLVLVLYPDEKHPQSSAQGFLDTTNGAWYKAASWKKPAKGLRAVIFDADHGLSRYDPYGGIS